MPTFPDEGIAAVQRRLLEGMHAYKKAAGSDCGYSDHEIGKCMKIVDAYLVDLSGGATKMPQAIRDIVKRVVLDLNGLNAKCGGSLIETDQREDLCQIILVAARQAGLQTNDDITEQWREW